MDWNRAVLDHPRLTPTEKLAFHLLREPLACTPQRRAHVAHRLHCTATRLRRICQRLRRHGFYVPLPDRRSPHRPLQPRCPLGAATCAGCPLA